MKVFGRQHHYVTMTTAAMYLSQKEVRVCAVFSPLVVVKNKKDPST